MSRFVRTAQEAVDTRPGVAELLSDPQHFRYHPMEVVNYDDGPAKDALDRWEPLLASTKPAPEPQRSAWSRLWSLLARKGSS